MKRSLQTVFYFSVFLFSSAFQDPQIRVEVEAVNVLVGIVTDKNGRFVTDLSAEEFEVFEDGVRQEVTNFGRETSLPLRIALLIDTSSSVRLHLDFQKQAATNFLHSILRLQDQALLVEFDTGVSLLHDFTNRPGTIAREIEKLRAGGGTALIDALYEVSREKMSESDARKTIVVVSDGRDLNSQRTLEDVLKMVHSSGVIVYAIGTNRLSADQDKKGEKVLEELTEKTGGRVFFPYSVENLASAFDVIDEELRSQYSLTYVPTNKARDGKFRKIRVKLIDQKGLTVRHREGYFAATE